ncbi:MAG: hypothetical protein FJ220_04520 [Kiritimatiellaceae bacterium]|nr:hypothetical protein [Kiritimatiellaceae bacterium]
MRKAVIGMTALLLASLQSGNAETVTTARDYAVDSDVVLESAVREVKSIPRDTANVVGDAVKMVTDETRTAVDGVKAVFAKDPVAAAEQAAMLEVASAWDSSNDIVFRSFKVSSAVGETLTTGVDTASGAAVDVSKFFSGVEFPEGTSAMYRPDFNRLFVRQTLDNVLSIEDVLADQHNATRDLAGQQVKVETKFIEVTKTTLDELGFKWIFNNYGLTNGLPLFDRLELPQNQQLMGSGLRTASSAMGAGAVSDTLTVVRDSVNNWSLIISALEQASDSDVLSAPSITTRDGKTATIWVGEDRMVPKSFEPKASSTSVYVEHSDWESTLLGVQLEVTPELREGGLIDLELAPRVMDLIGYDTYNVVPTNAVLTVVYDGYDQRSSPVNLPQLDGRLPYFRVREMSTKATVADGSTVAMGGLIYDKTETYKDKVPVLGSIPYIGRLFRTEGEKSVKRNLIIFVTATEMDVNGRQSSDLAMKK